MSEQSVWRLKDFKGVSTDECDIAAYALLSEGIDFGVVISGPKGMTVRQMVNALRAALWHAARAGGQDLTAELKARLPVQGELTAPGKLS